MPLIHSTGARAFGENVKREMAAGRPQKQAVAIAYSERREAAKDSHHSSHSARRSEHYHKMIAPTRIQKGATKMTQARGLIKNRDEDQGEEF